MQSQYCPLPCKYAVMHIQHGMVEYFGKRNGPMAKDGISALQKSLAAIYNLPFQCGVNLYFRFSGVQLCLVRCATRHPCLAAGLWLILHLAAAHRPDPFCHAHLA